MTPISLKSTIAAIALLTSTTIAVDCSNAFCCPPGTFRKSTACVSCPPGTWKQRTANDTSCHKCHPGTHQPFSGSSNPDTCRECPPGTFGPRSGHAVCNKCPPGKASNHAATSCSVACPAGSAYAFKRQYCKPCRRGTFTTTTGNVYCEWCNDGFTTSGTGNTKCRRCRSNEPCFTCNDNYQVRDPATGICRNCPLGTFTSKFDGIVCRLCPEGTYRSIGTEPRCTKCPDGQVTKGPGAIVCRQPKEKCPPQMFLNSVGNCDTCGWGSEYNRNKKKCQKCTGSKISPGGLKSRCVNCPGMLVPDVYGKECGCPAGRFMNNNKNCIRCPPNTLKSTPWHRETYCEVCKNRAAPDAGCMQPCLDDEISQVSARTGRTECVKCPFGFVPEFPQMLTGSYGTMRRCVRPQTGCQAAQRVLSADEREVNYDKSHNLVCADIVCARNAPARSIGRSCRTCRPGHRFSDGGKASCTICQYGKVSAGGFSTKCTECDKGTVSNDDGSKCICLKGKAMVKGICKPCDGGTFSKRSDSQCKPCRAGTFSARKASVCHPCPAYFFSESPGSIRCEKCPKGTVSNRFLRGTKCIDHSGDHTL